MKALKMMREGRGEVDLLGVFPIFGLLKFTNADCCSHTVLQVSGTFLKEQVRTTLDTDSRKLLIFRTSTDGRS